MSGEHGHPELVDTVAGMHADLVAMADRLNRLTAQVVALEAVDGTQDIYDYNYLGKPTSPQIIGREWVRLSASQHDPTGPGWENTLVYLNITPRFATGKAAGALRPRLVRADGDVTMYDDILLHVDALDGDGVSCRNRLYWEAGDGAPTFIELRCIGGLASAVLGTRYRKVALVKDRG
jgi:acetyl esterase/lipase